MNFPLWLIKGWGVIEYLYLYVYVQYMLYSVVLQMCHVLQYLCDCQVRHRIEAVVAFSDDFVACLQDNQRFRYNEVMLALNMSAALTAKKTKEFRSPPQEQVGAVQSHV